MVLIPVLLAVAVASALVTVVGLLLPGSLYRRLHYLGPLATIGVAAVTAAVVVQEGFGQAGLKAIVTGGVLFAMNPILTHATARAARVRERGGWDR